MDVLARLAAIRDTQQVMLREIDELGQQVDEKVRNCDSTACRARLAEIEAELDRLSRLPPAAPPALRPTPPAPPALRLAPFVRRPSAPRPSVPISKPACDQSYRTFSSAREEVQWKLLLRSQCTPRILLPESYLRVANDDAKTLKRYIDTPLEEKTVKSLLFQMLWNIMVMQYTWQGARLDGNYLATVPVHVYTTPRAHQLTVGDEKVTFRIDSVVIPVFYNVWFFMTCKVEGSRVPLDVRPRDDAADCTRVLEEFSSHPEEAFDIARKLLKYRSNAYALLLSDEFKSLRAPSMPTDTLLRL